MSTNISKICNQQSIELNTDKLSNQNISENKGSTTNIGDNINQAKSLSSAQQNALNHIGKVLEKTYHLNSSDVDNIKAFVSALDKQINEQIEKQSVTGGAGIVENLKAELKSSEKLQKNIDACMNAKTSFFTQLKFLCAKIASFFGNNSKLEKLQEKGLEQFNELRGLLTKNSHGKNFLISFLEDNSSNKEAIKGMFKCGFCLDDLVTVLGEKKFLSQFKSEIANGSLTVNDKLSEKFVLQFKSEILDGSLKIRDKDLLLNDSFVKSIDVNNKKEKEVEGFAKAFYWADCQLAEQAVSANMGQELSLNEMKKTFSENCTLFKDIARNYSCSFTIGGETLNIPAHTEKNRCVQIIENAIRKNSFSKTEANALKNFCAKFLSQGVLANCYPNSAVLFPMGGEKIDFYVQIDDNGDTHVKVAASQDHIPCSSLVNDTGITEFQNLEIPIKVESEFSFTYKEGIVACNGIASNVKVSKYEQKE
mgnify:CR=1 FL=1